MSLFVIKSNYIIIISILIRLHFFVINLNNKYYVDFKMKIKLKYLFIISLTVIILIIFKYLKIQESDEMVLEKLKIYPKNNFYVTNNNMALYSSYIIIGENDCRIEAIAEYKYYRYDLNLKRNIKCVLKYLKDSKNYEIIELFPIDFANITVHRKYTIAIKYYFNFKLENFKSYLDEPKSFDLERIVVAVISINDFDKSVNEEEFLNEININILDERVKLPFSLITYQKPGIIKTNTLKASVAVCGAQFYGNSSNELFNWIYYQQSFGVAEIMIYDGTINKTVSKFVNENFKTPKQTTKLTTAFDQSLFYEQCEETIFYKQFDGRNNNKLNRLMLNLCKKLFRWSHRSTAKNRKTIGSTTDRQRIIVLNDCFIKLSQKYEFVAIYDFDEFIFPRNFNHLNKPKRVLSCDNKKEICNKTPFFFDKNTDGKNKNHLYNYLNYLIKRDKKNRNPSKLAAVEFSRIITLSDPQKNEKEAVDMLESLIKNIKPSTSKFPIHFNFSIYEFKILKNDIDHIKYLLKSYKEFVSCFYRDHVKNIKLIDTDKIRSFYFSYKWGSKYPKTILYSKNVKTFGIHKVIEIVKNSWILQPSVNDGHFCSHYRFKTEDIHQKFLEPIRNLNIDFEYLIYILKSYTNYCE